MSDATVSTPVLLLIRDTNANCPFRPETPSPKVDQYTSTALFHKGGVFIAKPTTACRTRPQKVVNGWWEVA